MVILGGASGVSSTLSARFSDFSVVTVFGSPAPVGGIFGSVFSSGEVTALSYSSRRKRSGCVLRLAALASSTPLGVPARMTARGLKSFTL